MKNGVCLLIYLTSLCCPNCSYKSAEVKENADSIKAQIIHILEIQENVYDNRDDKERAEKMAATCEDSLLFVGGDDAGVITSSYGYAHDLGDGYTIKPYDRLFRIYDHTVIVTSLHQAYKLLGKDTLYLNARSTKVFIKDGKEWKMAYVTFAPLPVSYTKPATIDAAGYAEYTGLYQSGATSIDTFLVDEGKLFVASPGYGRSQLFPLNDSTFTGEGYFGKTVFERNASGKVIGYYFELIDDQRIHFRKLK